MTRFLAVIVTCASLTVCQTNVEAEEPPSTSGSLSPVGDDQLRSQDLVFHVTDFGINQLWSENLRVGDPFPEKQARVFRELDGTQGAQILIPMPTDKELDEIPVARLADYFASKLAEQVNRARAKGVTTFEIQMLENISKTGYATADWTDRQDKVKTFGAIAYEAIARLVSNQKQTGRSLELDLTLGSNGTFAFTENIGSWKICRDDIRKVTLVDGRAFFDPTRDSIIVLGPEKVRIINTRGDLWAFPDLLIGNSETVRRLLNEKGFEMLTALVLKPEKLYPNQMAHVSSMGDHPYDDYVVTRIQGKQEFQMGNCTARQIQRSEAFWNAPSSPNKPPSGEAAFTSPTSLPLQQSQTPLPKVGGVLMPANVSSNQAKDLKKFHDD